MTARVAEISDELASLVGEIAAVSDPVHQRLELLGLTTAGRGFCEDLSARYDVAIHFQDEDVPRDLPPDIALALFRVLQEATVNAVVHSAAREVWVSVRGTAAEIRLQVVDRGVGFDTQRAVPGRRGRVGGDPRTAQTRQRRQHDRIASRRGNSRRSLGAITAERLSTVWLDFPGRHTSLEWQVATRLG